jgi:rhodanese-related sulfurtransferase
MHADLNITNSVINLDSESFAEKFKNDSKAVLLDVRTLQEFNAGHIPNSKLIDIYLPSFPEKISELDKENNYYIYCRSGNRSYHAGVFMLQQGFKTVYNLADGILDWHEPLER